MVLLYNFRIYHLSLNQLHHVVQILQHLHTCKMMQWPKKSELLPWKLWVKTLGLDSLSNSCQISLLTNLIKKQKFPRLAALQIIILPSSFRRFIIVSSWVRSSALSRRSCADLDNAFGTGGFWVGMASGFKSNLALELQNNLVWSWKCKQIRDKSMKSHWF